eukprot:gene5714-9001_t
MNKHCSCAAFRQPYSTFAFLMIVLIACFTLEQVLAVESYRALWPISKSKRTFSNLMEIIEDVHSNELKDVFTEDQQIAILDLDTATVVENVNLYMGEEKYLKAYLGLFILFQQHQDFQLLKNAAVLLEKVNLHNAALLWYEMGLLLFPSQQVEIYKNMYNTIQNYATILFARGMNDEAHRAYDHLFKLPANIEKSHYNMAMMLENSGDYEGAIKQLNKFKDKAHNEEDLDLARTAICRISLRLSQSRGATLLSDAFETRQKYFAIARDICAEAFENDPSNAQNSYSLGLLHREGASYEASIKFFEDALKKDPNNLEYEHQLASTLARVAEVERTEKHIVNVMEKVDIYQRPQVQFAFGVLISPLVPNHPKAKIAMHDAVMNTPMTKAPPSIYGLHDCSTESDSWTVAVGAGATSVGEVHLLTSSTGRVETKIHGVAPFVLDFPDKAINHVIFKNAIIQGSGGVIVAQCEVVAYMDANTNLPAEFEPTSKTPKRYTGKTLYVLHPKISNYYHTIAEVMTRFAVALVKGVVGQMDRILWVNSNQSPVLHDFVTILKEFSDKAKEFEHLKWLEYDTTKRYNFTELHVVTYTHPSGVIADDIDMWDSFLPSSSAAVMLNQLSRDIIQRVRALKQSPIQAKARRQPTRPKVIYCTRAGVRSVLNEEILLERLRDHPDIFDFHVFSSPPPLETMPRNSFRNALLYQMDLFSDADIIIGPHGAGLTNMMFSEDAIIMEFIMSPHGNRCFGYLAAALKHNYYAISDVTSTYFGSYDMTEDAAAGIEAKLLAIAMKIRPKRKHEEL